MLVFDFQDYKKFISEQVAQNREARGYQSKLAKAAKCQPSYFSLVLHSHHHLHLDQAMGLCDFWHFADEEADWFLELVNLARAESDSLRRRIQARLKKMREAREERDIVSVKFKKPRLQTPEMEQLYYSAWHWSALHILTSIPAYRETDAIAERLELPKALVQSSLSKLESLGLVKKVGTQWRIIPGGLFIPRDSPLSRHHHANWRQRALLDAQNARANGLHYTYVASLSESDFQRIKNIFLETIERTGQIIKASPEEELSCTCLDFFRV